MLTKALSIMALPFDLDHESFQHESILAGMGMDLARASVLPEEEGNRLAAAWADFFGSLSEWDREVVWYWFDLVHPVPWPRDPLSVWLRSTRT